MLSDLRYALRSLTRAWGFTLTVVLTLALGIGAAAAIFSVTYWVLFRSEPWPDKDRLFVIGSKSISVRMNASDVAANAFIVGVQFEACREQMSLFSEYAASRYLPVNVVIGGAPLQLPVQLVSPDFFHTLGLAPMLGRGFLPEEFKPGADDVAVISHRCWQEFFGGVPDVLGRELQVGRQRCKIVGVLPPDAQFPAFAYADICRPFVFRVDPAKPWDTIMFAVGRLKPGVTPAQANAALAAVKLKLAPQFAKGFEDSKLSLIRLDELKRYFRPEIYWMLVGAVGFLYAIACLNAANLLLIRVLGKRRELSIRLALGGGRWRTIRLFAAEGALLSALSCGGALLVTHWIFPLLIRATMPNLGWGTSLSLDWRVLGVMGGLTAVTCLLIVLVPAARVFRADVQEGLKEGGLALGETPRQARLRDALVVLQAAFAVILLAGAGLMVRTLQRLQQVDLGFDPAGKVKVQLTIPADHHAEREDRLLLFLRLQQRLRAIPGVKDAAFGSNALLAGFANPSTKVRLPDGTDLPIARDDVSYDFQRTAGLTLLKGAWLPEKRDNGKQVVINASLARRLFGDRDPIGQALPVLENNKVQPLQIVGVVKDVRESARSAPELHYYCSDWWWPPNLSTFLLRLGRDPDKAFEGLVRRAVYEFDPDLSVWQVQAMNGWIDTMQSMERTALAILQLLSGFALVLATVGLFSVLAYTVDRRAGEFGVRLALGATPRNLAGLVLRRGVVLSIVGVGVGVAGALGLTRFLRSLLYETASYEPVVYTAVAAILLVAAVAACWLPARRAARIDVARLLRAE